MFDELEVDLVAMNEIKINFGHKKNINGLSQMFNGGDAAIKVVHGCNNHDGAISRVQEGGTGLITYGALVEQFDHLNSGADTTGLGRFTYARYIGENGIATWVVCGYQPCASKGPRTNFQQQRRYFIDKGTPDVNPRDKFYEDLISLLQGWRENGDRIILCLDANENIYTKRIGKALTDVDGLAMREVVGDFTGIPLGATYFRGSKPIDGVWATRDIEVVNACVMPVGYGVGDHRCFVVDFTLASVAGTSPVRVKKMTARRLNTKIPGVEDRYNALLEKNLIHHNVDDDHRKAYFASTKEDASTALEHSEGKSRQYMVHAEKRCRRIKSGRIPFSSESVVWIERSEIYGTLLKYHDGKKINKGNLRRKCRKQRIVKPFRLSVDEVRGRLKACNEKCDYFRKHGKKYRRKHLNRRLEIAKKKGDETAQARILGIIKGERDRAFWRRLNYCLGKRHTGSIRSVQVISGDDVTTEFATKDSVEKAILSNIHGKGKRFYLAEEAPICKGNLRGQFGYNADTVAARMVLDGTYEFSEEDYHEATHQLFEQIAKIRLLVPMNSVETLIDEVTWAKSWKRSKEKTSSSISGLHFGHYIAGSSSAHISNYHAVKTSIALMRGISLSRWQRGLACMLEKKAGSRLVNKLRSILLLEADFNKANKIIYGERMMANIRRYHLMPEEIFSERNRTADDGALSKILFFDIGRQLRVPSAIASVDASNCYDRVAHAIASLIFQAFGVDKSATTSMLSTIQDMKYFLRTAYGDSTRCETSTIEVKYQGLCQGNGAAPAGWAAVSITILMAHKAKGHGATFICPLSTEKSIELAAILFVDDTDIIHLNMKKRETVQEVHSAISESVRSWNELLMATGGTLHPDKCFYYLMSYSFDKHTESWHYVDHSEDEDFDIELTLPDGTPFLMKHHPVNHPETMLGVATCPIGSCHNKCNCSEDCKGVLDILKEKATDCAQKVLGSRVNRRQVWTWISACFWNKVKYGLCCNTGNIATLQESLGKTYYQLLPLCGVIRSAPTELRDLASAFYGVGLPNVAIECCIEQLNKLQMHYGCPSSVGFQLQTSMELFIVQLGRSLQPFDESYSRYQSLITNCWLKAVWEKVDYYGIKVVLNNIKLPFPKEGDRWLMQVFEEIGCTEDELHTLNRVRLHQQVLFLSDVLCTQGKRIDSRYMDLRPDAESWSSLIFPYEDPSIEDLHVWIEALACLSPHGRLHHNLRLGDWKTAGHKFHEWRFNEEEDKLLCYYGDHYMDVYTSLGRNRYSLDEVQQDRIQCGVACTVSELSPGTFRVLSRAAIPSNPPPPDTLWEVLQEWGGEWLWDDLELSGNFDFLVAAILDGSLVCVSDGSYIKEMFPDICSAAFILECSKGRGRIVGRFAEKTLAACAYRGELLGLLAIHLILLAVNKLHTTLDGSVHIYSDCLGALHNVQNLPPTRIPSGCRHSDILKILMIHCQNMTFSRSFSHVSAHKLDHGYSWTELNRPEQLNDQCDSGAKLAIYEVDPMEQLPAQPLPLEPACVYVNQGREKMTSDTGHGIRFHAHRTLARSIFFKRKILSTKAFDEVDWRNVSNAIHSTPKLFQLFACKQVNDIAGTNSRLHLHDETNNPLCPSCLDTPETCAHILMCEQEDRVTCFRRSAKNLQEWLRSVGTCEMLEEAIMLFVKSRNSLSFMECIDGTREPALVRLAKSQDEIGWRRFMEGMVSKEFCKIQDTHSRISGNHILGPKWAQGLSLKLLEFTHGLWLVRNFLIHDKVSGMLALERKEEIQVALEEQLEMGTEGLEEDDLYLMEINLEDLESTSGEHQAYWLLAVQAARDAFRLRRQQSSTSSSSTQHHG